jgi:primary-amine oxidase
MECLAMSSTVKTHPLDPLDAGEIARAVALARTAPGLSDRIRIIFVEAREPEKAAYHAWRTGGAAIPRTAIVTLNDCGHGRGLVVEVDLDGDRLGPVTELGEGVQPAISGDEFWVAADVMRADPRFREAIAKRGIDDPDKVYIEAWSAGTHEPGPRRMVRALCWLKEHDLDNQYARPLYGLVGAVDINALELVRLDDHAPGTPPPPLSGEYRNGGGRPYRSDVRPLEIAQPEGPGFELDGHGVRWQKWEVRVGFHPREGLVLHDLAYHDDGERRQICHRASIAELVIPYGDPNPTVHFKNVFDIGEYGLGPLTNSLSLGCDCLGEIRYLDAVTNTYTGDVFEIPNAICVHEEDYGLLWKHTDEAGRVDRARSRRLVISSIATVGNYEYGFFWYLFQDGTIQFEGKLTGIVHSAGWIAEERSPYSLPLGEGFVTSHHQHFFCARLDLDIDGTANTAFSSEAFREPWGAGNPDGVAFRPDRRTYTRESDGRDHVNPGTARRFRVENPARRNRIGDPVSYELVPGDTVDPMQQPDSSVRQRARFIDYNLWVTPYRAEERYPAGEFPNQHAGEDGLPAWTAADRPLEDEDVVLWYVFGAHHFPRLEDWPVMPVAYCGFSLRPVGFFDRNPALDVPPPRHCDH